MMRKLKTGFLNTYSGVLSALLALLGFSTACDHNSEEYGTPHATFVIKGIVESADESSPIANIKVKMGYDSTLTDNSGNYQVEVIEFPKSQTFEVGFYDIDGAAHGEYQQLDTIVEFKDPKFTGSSGTWDEGKTEKEINVKLKPKR